MLYNKNVSKTNETRIAQRETVNMKHGSLQNLLLNNVAPTMPEVGMGCTEIMWTDRNPCTIVSVSKTGKSFEFTYDDYKRIDKNGLSDWQTWEYTSRPDAPRYKARLCKDGRYKCRGLTIFVGEREKYSDPSF